MAPAMSRVGDSPTNGKPFFGKIKIPLRPMNRSCLKLFYQRRASGSFYIESYRIIEKSAAIVFPGHSVNEAKRFMGQRYIDPFMDRKCRIMPQHNVVYYTLNVQWFGIFSIFRRDCSCPIYWALFEASRNYRRKYAR